MKVLYNAFTFLAVSIKDPYIQQLILKGIGETIYMTVVSTLFAYVFGLPMGVILVITAKDGITPNKTVNAVLGTIINIFRSIPFLILLVLVLPVTRFIVGTTIGSTATIVPLVIAAAPYVARMVEQSLLEVDKGVIEAARGMGTPDFKIITKVIVPEAMPSLLVGAAIALTTILGYSAMAGFVGGGGLGTIATNYGYYQYNDEILIVTVIVIVLIVQLMQTVGMKIAKAVDHRLL